MENYASKLFSHQTHRLTDMGAFLPSMGATARKGNGFFYKCLVNKAAIIARRVPFSCTSVISRSLLLWHVHFFSTKQPDA